MANDERFTGPNVPPPPDRADEVQRRTPAPPNPAQPPSSQAIKEIDAEKPEGARAALFPNEDVARLRNQWTEIQGAFVDEPKSAVTRADRLVGDVLKSLQDSFAKERTRLESQWDRDGDVSTEDFRVALRRYRSFFDRLLSI